MVFVLPTVSRGSGGIADILHLGQAVQNKGEKDVYYLLPEGQSPGEDSRNLQWACPDLEERRILTCLEWVPEVLCATAWYTVYRALDIPSRKKLYFVQDYEPWFIPAGVERYYAQRTYEMGLPILTLGPWLTHHLDTLGINAKAGAMPFPSSDPGPDFGSRHRRRILFYLQPDKRHRGSELLIETARLLAGDPRFRKSGHVITFFGSRINEYISFEFPCEVRGVVAPADLRNLMQEAHVGVSASFTNISLMPFRYLAHGAVPVEIDLPNVRMNIPEEVLDTFTLCRPDAESLASGILQAITGPPSRKHMEEAARLLSKSNAWSVGAGILAKMLGESVEQ